MYTFAHAVKHTFVNASCTESCSGTSVQSTAATCTNTAVLHSMAVLIWVSV